MNPSYLRIRRPLADAMSRYSAWLGLPELAEPREVADLDACALATENGRWRGMSVYVFSSGDWTVFQELSGGLAARSDEDWVRLADGGDLIFAGYDSGLRNGWHVRVEGGKLVRRFLHDEEDPSADVNWGRLPEEGDQPFAHWIDAAAWVDGDEPFTASDRGLLWIHDDAG